MITQEMIEIASAAYWAADARNGDKRLAKSTEPPVNPLRAAIESIYSQLIAKASPAPIAAEADTAKVEPSLSQLAADYADDIAARQRALNPSTPDRLAPIEARGVLETIRFHLRRGDHVGADGHRCTQQLLDAIDKTLRARESTTAVEEKS